uniref:Uncharacterized protein n=1 Tax=viral metagenome TaxID=1070528 RepID=A0A6C0H8J9_9ZZZZ
MGTLFISRPYIKSKGWPNKYVYDFYVNHIYNITLTGLSWTSLSELVNIIAIFRKIIKISEKLHYVPK